MHAGEECSLVQLLDNIDQSQSLQHLYLTQACTPARFLTVLLRRFEQHHSRRPLLMHLCSACYVQCGSFLRKVPDHLPITEG